MKRSYLLAAAVVVSVGLVLSACGSSGGNNEGGGGSGSDLALTIQGFAFHPDTLTAPGGQQATLTITNKDTVTHNFTLDQGGVSRDIPAGQTVSVTVPFPTSGTAGFHCRFHTTMTGKLEAG